MRLTKCFSISMIIVIILLCVLCSCAEGGSSLETKTSPAKEPSSDFVSETYESNSETETFSSEKPLVDLVSKTYNEAQLLEIVKYNGSMDELNAQYPIECLREREGVFRVAYLGENSVAVVLFDNSGNKILGGVHSTLKRKSDFSCLSKGQPLEDVRGIDPDGEYLFLYTGRNDAPKESTHYTKDGYLITIEYDDSNTIIGIEEEFI